MTYRVFTLPFSALLFLTGFSMPAHSAECLVSGATLDLATTSYSNQCTQPRQDCDKVNNIWYCSSENIDAGTVDTVLNTSLHPTPVSPSLDTATSATTTLGNISVTRNAECIDTDGDGWGWDGKNSCKIGLQTPAATNHSGNDCVDSDGDGWGWDGKNSCKIGVQRSAATNNSGNACVDPDGDGWGWDGKASCRISSTISPIQYRAISYSAAGSEVPGNCAKLNSGDYHITELVTDVFLTAGQSNAAGARTNYDPQNNAQDRVNTRLLVWTENHQWEIADPATQIWHNGQYPSGTGHVYNHPAFQIGRSITERDGCRVVAFIATAAPGQPIDYWRYNQDNHYKGIAATVTNAINALPVKHQLDMIWWMQGEADNDQYITRYYEKLQDLIARLRSESWFPHNGYFLANETGWFTYANEAIRLLGQDNDPFTDFSRGADTPTDPFPHRSDEGTPVHFNETALRKIGDLVADKYLNTYLKKKQ